MEQKKHDSLSVSDLVELGRTIRKRRRTIGLSQLHLSRKCGVGRQRISQMENGSFCGRITDVCRVLQVLGLRLGANDIEVSKEGEGDSASESTRKSLLLKRFEERYGINWSDDEF